MTKLPDDLSVPAMSYSLSGSSVATTTTYQTALSVLQNNDLVTGDIPIVAIMGNTGVGKSTFIKIATNANDIRIGDTLTSCTQEIQIVRCHNPTQNSDILLIDTPGFDDTSRTDAEILEQVAQFLKETYQTGIKLSGILYLHRITDNRMSGTHLRNLSLLQSLCGSDALSSVALVTTHWDELQEPEGIRNEEQLRDDHWSLFLKHGSQMLRFEHTPASAWKIINSLPMVRMPLKIQQEMVDQGKILADTTAGQSLVGWFVNVTKVLKDFIRRLERLARKNKDKHGNERVLDEARIKLEEIEGQQSRLVGSNSSGQAKKTLGRRLTGKFDPRSVNSQLVKSNPSEVLRNIFNIPIDPPVPLSDDVPVIARSHTRPSSDSKNDSKKPLNGVPDNVRQRLCDLTTEIASSKDSRKAFGDMLSKGIETRFRAQAVADYLNFVLHDTCLFKETDRTNILRLFCELSRSAEVYPRCYILERIHMAPDPLYLGGFADVYKGQYEGQVVCCKVLRLLGDNNRHANILRTFAKEIVLWAHSSHENILPFYGIYTLGDSIQRISLISPWMRNGNLRQYLGNSPDARRVSLVQDVIEGLVYLHESKIVHGDLKTENILVSDEGRALITDFGLSFVAMSVVTGSGQSPTTAGGTMSWMAPELISGPAPLGKSTQESDIWSFGCVCYETFTGKHPFYHCRSQPQVIMALLRGEIPSRPEPGDELVCAEYEDWTWEMMLGCWKRDPQNRYTGKVIQELLKPKIKPGKRLKAPKQQKGGSALREAMKAQSEVAVDYQLVESILVEFLRSRKEGKISN